MGLVVGGLDGLATEFHHLIKPATVIGWHRKGFGLIGTWKIHRGRLGRPAVPADVRSLIRTMSRDNPLWGAPRIHGELLKLGFAIGETSVSKYLVWPENSIYLNQREIIPGVVDKETTRYQSSWTRSVSC